MRERGAARRAAGRSSERLSAIKGAGRVEGPDIVVYQLGPYAQEVLKRLGPPPREWWRSATASPEAAATAYARWYGPFARQLLLAKRGTGRCIDVFDAAEAYLVFVPRDGEVLVAAMQCGGEQGRWRDVRALAERAIPVLARDGFVEPRIALEYAWALSQTGDVARARHGLEALVSHGDDAIVREARRRLLQLPAL